MVGPLWFISPSSHLHAPSVVLDIMRVGGEISFKHTVGPFLNIQDETHPHPPTAKPARGTEDRHDGGFFKAEPR